MDKFDLQRLWKLRNSLSKNISGFPFLCCRMAAEAVEKEFGYPVVGDAFVLVPCKKARDHYWNKTPTGEYVDLAGDQFNDRLNGEIIPPVNVVSIGSKNAERFYCLEKDADCYVNF